MTVRPVPTSKEDDVTNDSPTIHRFPAQREGAFVNAYLVETDNGWSRSTAC
jgi:hypothetical protein